MTCQRCFLGNYFKMLSAEVFTRSLQILPLLGNIKSILSKIDINQKEI